MARRSKADAGAKMSPRGDIFEDIDATKLFKSLRKHPRTLEAIAAEARCSTARAAEWVGAMVADGLNLQQFGNAWSLESGRPAPDVVAPLLELISDDDDNFYLGAMGDTHLGSKYERLDVLNDLYDRYESEGIQCVFHAGNWIEGEARFNKYDIAVYGMQNQLNYLAEHYPQREGISTYAVSGDDHEGWYCQREGVDIGKMAVNTMRDYGRDDWFDLGYMESYVKLVNKRSGASSIMAVVHPGGGSSYATSYTVQKIVESYSGGSKPAVLLAGHYHKMEIINIRNVWAVQTGCTQDQTPFMRKKRLEAHVGGHTLAMRQDPFTGAIIELNGIKRYFDVGYYNKRWSHAGRVVLPRRTLGGVA